MSDADRDRHIARLSTPSSYLVLHTLSQVVEPITVADLATAAAVSQTTCREVLGRAIGLGWATRHSPTTDTGTFTLTPEGRLQLDALHASVIDVNASAIDHDDQPPSTTMTTPTGRRGKPAWCTPGSGVCTACQEPS